MPLGSALKKKLLILHPMIDDRKPYRSSAMTLWWWENRERSFLLTREEKVDRSQSVVWDVGFL